MITARVLAKSGSLVNELQSAPGDRIGPGRWPAGAASAPMPTSVRGTPKRKYRISHTLRTWNLGTVDHPQLGSGPLLVAIPSQRSINGIFFRRPSPQDPGPLLVAIPSQRSINGIFFRCPSPQDPGKSLGASFREPGILR